MISEIFMTSLKLFCGQTRSTDRIAGSGRNRERVPTTLLFSFARDSVGLCTIQRSRKNRVRAVDSQERLQRLAVVVRRVRYEVVERVPEPGLSEHLERRASHPPIDVDFFKRIIAGKALIDRIRHLQPESEETRCTAYGGLTRCATP